MPYRTFDDRIDGLVITFIDMSDLKQAELKLHEAEQVHHFIFNSTSDMIIKLSTDWKILEFSSDAENFFGKKRVDVFNQNFVQIFISETLQKKTEKDMKKLLNHGSDGKFKMKVIAFDGKMRVVEWSVNILFNNMKKPAGMIMIAEK